MEDTTLRQTIFDGLEFEPPVSTPRTSASQSTTES